MQQGFPAAPPGASALALSGGVFSNSFHTAPEKPSRLLSIPSTSGTQASNLANKLMAFCFEVQVPQEHPDWHQQAEIPTLFEKKKQ